MGARRAIGQARGGASKWGRERARPASCRGGGGRARGRATAASRMARVGPAVVRAPTRRHHSAPLHLASVPGGQDNCALASVREQYKVSAGSAAAVALARKGAGGEEGGAARACDVRLDGSPRARRSRTQAAGPSSRARRSMSLLRNTRELVQMQRLKCGEEGKTIALEKPLASANVENLKSRATESLLGPRRSDRRLRRNIKCKLLIINNTTRAIDKRRTSEPRSLDHLVQFLHERQFHQQRPPIRRLGLHQVAPQHQRQQEQQPEQQQENFMTSRLGAGDVGTRMSVSRLVPPVRSSSTQTTTTTRVIASSPAAPLAQAQTRARTRRSPYNTRQRAREMAAALEAKPSPAHHGQQQGNSQQDQRRRHHPDERRQHQQQQRQHNNASGRRLREAPWPALNETDEIKVNSRAHDWLWSCWDKSHECVVTEDRRGVCFHPHSSESAAACRAAEPLRRNGNQYYWELQVLDKCYGTAVMFGLCTQRARLHVNDYCNLVGSDDQGWSLSHKGLVWHNGQKAQYTEEFPREQSVTVGLLYNTVRGELSFFLNGRSLGVAFTGLNNIDQELYPVVGSTAKCTRMRLVSSRQCHASLRGRSCFSLLKHFAHDRYGLVEHLRRQGTPRQLLEYVAEVANVDADEVFEGNDQRPRQGAATGDLSSGANKAADGRSTSSAWSVCETIA